MSQRIITPMRLRRRSPAPRSRQCSFAVALCWLSLLLGLPYPATAVPFDFTEIVKTGGTITSISELPVINSVGDIAYLVRATAGSQSLQRFDGTSSAVIATIGIDQFQSGDPFQRIDIFHLNTAGEIAFAAETSIQSGVFVADGTGLRTIYDSTRPENPGAGKVGAPHINDDGDVVFRGQIGTSQSILVNRGSGNEFILETGPTFSSFSTPRILNDGTVLYEARRNDGVRGLFRNSGSLVMEGERLVYNQSLDLAWVTPSFCGGVANGQDLVLSTAGTMTSLLSTCDTTFNDIDVLSLNNSGSILFRGISVSGIEAIPGLYLLSGTSIFPILEGGDLLNGEEILNVRAARFDSLNDSGEMVVRADFASGRSAILYASRIASLPSPSTAFLLSLGFVSLLILRVMLAHRNFKIAPYASWSCQRK